MRPDRIIVGEVRGAEAVDMIQAMCSGHNGSLSCGHGNSIADMLYRLETMVLMGMELPAQVVRRQLASGIDLMVHLGRLRDKRRVILEISEIEGCKGDEIILNPLYRFRQDTVPQWERTGELLHKEKLLMAGF